LSNALKFSENDVSPIISITSRVLPAEEIKKYPALNVNVSYTEIIFGDNGIGFDKEFAEKIFLIFQRLNAREHFEGTGIGLALCKRIITSHHGEIYAEAKEGEGARFHIILPYHQ